MTAADPWRQLLRDAADRIARDGWCQGKYADGRRRCLLGAIGFSIVNEIPEENVHAACQVRAVLRARGVSVNGHVSIAAWNDAPGRTADEVIALLREAAEAA